MAFRHCLFLPKVNLPIRMNRHGRGERAEAFEVKCKRGLISPVFTSRMKDVFHLISFHNFQQAQICMTQQS